MSTGFTCPFCPDHDLVLGDSTAECGQCRRSFPADPEWINVSNQPGFYWGELARPLMQHLVESPGSITDALRQAIRECDADLGDYLRHYAFDSNRAAWKFLLPLPPGARILDMGCGLGALSLSLAEHASEMIVADLVPERVRLTMRRLKEDHGASVKGVVTSGLPHLPLPAQSVDLVVVNGVLEWIPTGVPGDPEEVQQAFLAEMARVLKPTGALYLGIENRFGASYFRGKREEHTKLRFVSLLPRPLGRLYHRVARRAPYRSYTYGRKDLERRLLTAGFSSPRFFYPYPDYREFVSVVGLDEPAWVASAFRPRSRKGRMMRWVVTRTRMLGRVANSFSVLAYRGGAQRSFLGRLIRHLMSEGLLPTGTRLLGYDVRATSVISAFVGIGERSHLISIPLNGTAARRLKRDAEMRSRIRRIPGLDFPEATIAEPHPLQFEGRDLLFTKSTRGPRLRDLSGASRDSGEDAASRWIIAFHRSSSGTGPFGPDRLLPEGWEAALGSMDTATDGRLGRLLAACVGQEVRIGPVHGDFHAGNIFISSALDIERVVDWDLASLAGLPLWDPLTVILHRKLDALSTWGTAYRTLFDAATTIPTPPGRLGRYFSALGIRPPDVVASLVTLPIVHLAVQVVHGSREGREIVAGTAEVLDAVRAERLESLLRTGRAVAAASPETDWHPRGESGV